MFTQKDLIMLGDSDFYALMSALRGPDGDFEALKQLFTARIRYLAGMRNAAYLNIRSIKAIPKAILRLAIYEAADANKHTIEHYINHIEIAITALYRAKLMTRSEYKFLSYTAHKIWKYTKNIINKHDLIELPEYLYYHHQPAFVR
jgi:hypothetical protein